MFKNYNWKSKSLFQAIVVWSYVELSLVTGYDMTPSVVFLAPKRKGINEMNHVEFSSKDTVKANRWAN